MSGAVSMIVSDRGNLANVSDSPRPIARRETYWCRLSSGFEVGQTWARGSIMWLRVNRMYFFDRGSYAPPTIVSLGSMLSGSGSLVQVMPSGDVAPSIQSPPHPEPFSVDMT